MFAPINRAWASIRRSVPIGIELLHEVRELVPLSVPLILDAKHCDLNTSSALAHYVSSRARGSMRSTLSRCRVRTIVGALSALTRSGCGGHLPQLQRGLEDLSSTIPTKTTPLYLKFVRECQLWASM